MVNVTLFESEALFSELRAEWNDLLLASTGNHIFLTYEWQSTWWEAYQPGQIWAFALRDPESGKLDGIAPWFIDTLPEGDRVVRSIGCVDVTDYLEIIIRRGREEAVLGALADYIAQHPDRFDEIRLCNVPQDSQTLTLAPAQFEDRGFVVNVQLQEVCPVVTLPTRWEDYIASLDKKNRHELRRKLRRATGSVDWYIVGPEHDLQQELARFMKLMAASSAEKAQFLQEPANRRFFEKVVPLMAEHGWLQLAFLTVNGIAAATYLNFDCCDRVLVYNSGHDAEQHGHLSPGIVLLARLIEHAINNGRYVFDFLRGDESYKYDMGGEDTSVYQIIVHKGAG
jgi:CelD/BcsL family acetyltransferase involved in cellulose biosynthesis